MPARTPRRELDRLLDALCDGWLDGDGYARLEMLLRDDPAARRRYLDLIVLHGTLHWDAGTHAAPVPTVSLLPKQVLASRRRAWAAVAATAAAVLVGIFSLRSDHPRPWAGEVTGVAEVPAGPDRADDTRVAANRTEPVVAPREPVAAPKPVVGRTPVAVASAEKVAPASDVTATIDRVLAQTWAAAGVEPSPVAPDGEWLRRVWLDLAGHAPPADAARRFLADRGSDGAGRGKYAAELDRLLTAESFGDHLAERWSTRLVGRVPDDAIDRDGLRDHLAVAFATDTPWDTVVAELLNAEGRVDEAPAANFLAAHVNNQAVPATAVTARVLLGTRVGCMQCHDHPSNAGPAWSQERFWELNAFFKGLDVERESVPGRGRVAALVARDADGPTFFEDRRGVMGATWPAWDGHRVEAGTGRRAKLADLLLADDEHPVARAMVNRVWADLFGAGLVEPVDDLGPHNPPSHPEIFDALTDRFVATGHDVRDLYRTIASSDAYRLGSAFGPTNGGDDPARGEVPLFSRVYPKAITPEQAFDTLRVSAGLPPDAEARDDWVRRFVHALPNEENGEFVDWGATFTQALTLMNDDLPGDTAAAAGDVESIFLATLSRRPTRAEARRLRPLVNRPGGPADLRWALLNSGEFATVP